MEFIEKAVKLSEAVKVFGIIEQVLKKQMSTQVYVANALYLELSQNGSNYHVYHSHLVKASHYNSCEEWLNHTEGGVLDNTIHLASFVKNCTNYMQLAQFEANALDYTHFDVDFKQLLLIEVEK